MEQGSPATDTREAENGKAQNSKAGKVKIGSRASVACVKCRYVLLCHYTGSVLKLAPGNARSDGMSAADSSKCTLLILMLCDCLALDSTRHVTSALARISLAIIKAIILLNMLLKQLLVLQLVLSVRLLQRQVFLFRCLTLLSHLLRISCWLHMKLSARTL